MSDEPLRYEVSFYIGPCTEDEAATLADAILDMAEFNAVGGGAVGIAPFTEDDERREVHG